MSPRNLSCNIKVHSNKGWLYFFFQMTKRIKTIQQYSKRKSLYVCLTIRVHSQSWVFQRFSLCPFGKSRWLLLSLKQELFDSTGSLGSLEVLPWLIELNDNNQVSWMIIIKWSSRIDCGGVEPEVLQIPSNILASNGLQTAWYHQSHRSVIRSVAIFFFFYLI